MNRQKLFQVLKKSRKGKPRNIQTNDDKREQRKQNVQTETFSSLKKSRKGKLTNIKTNIDKR